MISLFREIRLMKVVALANCSRRNRPNSKSSALYKNQSAKKGTRRPGSSSPRDQTFNLLDAIANADVEFCGSLYTQSRLLGPSDSWAAIDAAAEALEWFGGIKEDVAVY